VTPPRLDLRLDLRRKINAAPARKTFQISRRQISRRQISRRPDQPPPRSTSAGPASTSAINAASCPVVNRRAAPGAVRLARPPVPPVLKQSTRPHKI